MSQKFIARACQIKMMRTMLNTRRCNIWAQPGMGKTAAVFAALDILWLCGSKYRPALVIAPLRVASDVWKQEAQKWSCFSHIKVQPIIGNAKARKEALLKRADVYVVNYENAQWLVSHYKKEWPFQIVIADEATKLKNFRFRNGGKRAAALAKISHIAGRWINLTGTPATNGLIDLWGMNWFIDKGMRLGSTFTSFKARWFTENVYAHTITAKSFAKEQIMTRLRDVTCSLCAADYFDLPPLIINNINIELPLSIRQIYSTVEMALLTELENGQKITSVNAAAKTVKCLQIASGAVYIDSEERKWEELHNLKIEALKELLEECAGQPLLCAYHYKHDVARILAAIPCAHILENNKDFSAWNAGRISLGLIHPASAGYGLNLGEGGRQIAFFSHWWNLEHYLQTVDRIGPTRQAQLGRSEPVVVHNLIARNTLDELAVERRNSKQELVDFLLKRLRR